MSKPKQSTQATEPEAPPAPENVVMNEAAVGSDSAPTQPGSLPSSQPAAQPAVPQPPQESGFTKFLRAVFGPETRLGRILRPTLRWLAAIVGLFALGLLAGTLLLYRPAADQLARTQAELIQVQDQLGQKQTDLQTAQADLKDARAQLDQTRTELGKAQTSRGLLLILHHVNTARVALTGRDGPIAKKSLEQAQELLSGLLPAIQEQDEAAAAQIESRLKLALSELNDPQTAQTDLKLLADKLLELEKSFQ